MTDTQTSEAPAVQELTVNDLSAIRQVLDLAGKRGAFATKEMAVVGQIYNKLDVFLQAVAATQAQNQETTGEAAEEAAEEAADEATEEVEA